MTTRAKAGTVASTPPTSRSERRAAVDDEGDGEDRDGGDQEGDRGVFSVRAASGGHAGRRSESGPVASTTALAASTAKARLPRPWKRPATIGE